jgi:hypothetical protein
LLPSVRLMLPTVDCQWKEIIPSWDQDRIQRQQADFDPELLAAPKKNQRQ